MNPRKEVFDWINISVLNGYGGKCEHCGQTNHNKLVLHHTFHDGFIVRKAFGNNHYYFI